VRNTTRKKPDTLDDTPSRDIYYNDVQLFKSQKTVDTVSITLVSGVKSLKYTLQLVDDLAATLDLDRSFLNIRASSKDLICGSGLTIRLFTGEKIRPTDTEVHILIFTPINSILREFQGTLIPVGEDIESFGLDPDVCWVLVVEKEASRCFFGRFVHQTFRII